MVKERRETCWELGDQEVWGRDRGRCPQQDADYEDACVPGGCRQDPSPAEAALNNQTDTGPVLYRSGPLARWPVCAVIMVGGTEARLRPLHPPPPRELICLLPPRGASPANSQGQPMALKMAPLHGQVSQVVAPLLHWSVWSIMEGTGVPSISLE